jgi:ribosomal protein S19
LNKPFQRKKPRIIPMTKWLLQSLKKDQPRRKFKLLRMKELKKSYKKNQKVKTQIKNPLILPMILEKHISLKNRLSYQKI